MRGKIELESEVGNGSTFRVKLRLVRLGWEVDVIPSALEFHGNRAWVPIV